MIVFCVTLWLFNSLPWKIPIFKNGKPSISMGNLYHGYVSNNQRVWLNQEFRRDFYILKPGFVGI